VWLTLFFLTCLLLSLFSLPSSLHADTCAGPSSGLIAWLKADEGAGATLNDSSGHPASGVTCSSNGWTTGKLAGAINFVAASSDFCWGSSSWRESGSFTLAGWIKSTSFVTSGAFGDPIVSEISSSNAGGTNYIFSTNTVSASRYFQMILSNGAALTTRVGATPLSTGTWYHFAAVYDSSAQTLHLYLNGALDDGSLTGTVPASLNTAITAEHIGYTTWTGAHLNAAVDDLRIYNRILSAAEITQLYNSSAPGTILYNPGYRASQYCDGQFWKKMGGAGDPVSGLIDWWKFDDGGGTSATDSAGSITGTLSGSTKPSWATGMQTGALSFNGSTAYVDTGNNHPLGAGAATASAWVYLTSYNASGFSQIFSQGSGGLDCDVVTASSQFSCSHNSFTNSVSTANNTAVLNQWQFFTVTRDGSGNLTLYVNGVQSGGTGQAGSAGAGTIGSAIGTRYDHPNYFWPGLIDDVRFYNRQLSAADIMTLYTSTGGESGDINSNLVGYWKLDENSGTLANDSSINGNTAALTNGPTWAAGKVNNAVTFDGVNDSVAPATGIYFGLGSFTYAAWINTTQTVTQRRIMGSFSAAAYVDLGKDLSTGSGLSSEINDGGGYTSYNLTSVNVSDGLWHHVALVVDRSANTVSLYVDGVAKLTTSHTYANNFGTAGDPLMLHIGNQDGLPYQGTIDEVRVYNRVLSPSDVLTLYNSTVTSCAAPVGYAGNTIYNADYHVPQVCNGANWIPMGKAWTGAAGGGCSNPAGSEGDLMYNGDRHYLQYCDGTNWQAAGGLRAATGNGLVGWWKLDDDGASSAITHVRSAKGTINGSATVAATFGAASTSGNLIAVAVMYLGATLNSVTDSKGNTYTLVGSPTTGAGGNIVQLAYAKNITGGATITVTANLSASSAQNEIVIHEISGADTSVPLVSQNGQAQTAPGTGTDALSSGALTFSGSNNYVFGFTVNEGNSATLTQGTGFTLGNSGSLGSSTFMSEYATQTQPATFTTGTSFGNYITKAMVFKPPSTNAPDASGNGNTGSLVGGPSWTTGEIGNALTFNGTTQYVTVPSTATQLNISGAWTVSAWVNLSALPTSGNQEYFVYKADSSSDINYAIGVSNGAAGYCPAGVMWTTLFTIFPGGNVAKDCYQPVPAITTGTWYLVTGTWDGTNLTLYVNGVSAATSAPGLIPASDNIWGFSIGDAHNNGSDGNFTSGTVDDTRIYNRALSAEEIWNLYLATGGQ
jgi:hypothetical protein